MPLPSLCDFHSEPMSGWEESGRYCTGRGPRWGLKEGKIGEDSEMGRRRYEKTARCGTKARYEKDWDGS